MKRKKSKKTKQKIKIKTGSEKFNGNPPAIAIKYPIKNRDRKKLKLVINQVEICLSLTFGVFNNNEMEMKKI